MKKLISILLVVASVFSLVITASASNINQKPSKLVGLYVQDISEELNDLQWSAVNSRPLLFYCEYPNSPTEENIDNNGKVSAS